MAAEKNIAINEKARVNFLPEIFAWYVSVNVATAIETVPIKCIIVATGK